MIGRALGGYTLRRQIAFGPWGPVFEAEHPGFGAASVEVLDSRFAKVPEQVKRFRAGGESLAVLHHEALQRIYDVGFENGRHFIARELIEGQPVARLLAERGRFELLDAFRIAHRVAGALEVAHRAGLRHREIRPSNILVDEARDRALLVGFPLEGPTRGPDSGFAVEHPWYVAPEQLRGAPDDARADVYALALVTFEMCAGQNPYRAELGEMVGRKLSAPPPSLRVRRPEVPPEADAVLQQALAVDPARRTPSAAAFAAGIEQILHPSAQAAPPRRPTPAPPGVAVPGPYRHAPPGPLLMAPGAAPRPGLPVAPQVGSELCMACEQPVGPGERFCSRCGVARGAPPCPRCGAPVSSALDRRVFYARESGHYPWHAGWDFRCERCGFEVAAKLDLHAGHRGLLGPPREGAPTSEVELRGGESVYTMYQHWEHQPIIELRVRRQIGANSGNEASRLLQETSISLTPEEWTAVMEALQGPLRPLLARALWTRDVT